MKHVLWVLKLLWAFPMPITGYLLRRHRLRSYGRTAVYTHRWWPKRFATAHWPTILVPRETSRDSERLMLHEHRHLQQQMWVGGVLFLLSYGLMWVGLWVWHGFQWYPAYRGVWWEVDARRYADHKALGGQDV